MVASPAQMLVGRLGEDALGAAAIGITYFNLMFYFLLGVSSALDTLASQACFLPLCDEFHIINTTKYIIKDRELSLE